MPKVILVVDDDPAVRTSLAGALTDGDTKVCVADSGEQALAMLGEAAPDLVLSDIRMAGLDGITLLQTLKRRAPGTDVILMTAYDDMPTVVAAMREGAIDFLPKPLDLGELRAVLARVFGDRRERERARRRAEEEAAPYRLDQLVGRDPHMMEIYRLVGQLAANRANVLIRGETGTGKEMIARAIHYNSPDGG